MTCDNCDGKGYGYVSTIPINSKWGYVKVPCIKCNGIGILVVSEETEEYHEL